MCRTSPYGFGIRDAHGHLLLVIVTNLHVIRVALHKAKADAPTIVHRDRVLPIPIALEGMQAIARGHPQVILTGCQRHVLQLADRSRGKLWRKPLGNTVDVKGLRALIRKRRDHWSM